jgi:hypothetical protein
VPDRHEKPAASAREALGAARADSAQLARDLQGAWPDMGLGLGLGAGPARLLAC